MAKGYMDAAAVMTGGVLEEHLRKLCIKQTIATVDASGKHKKASTVNDDSAKDAVYEKLEQKNVTAWLDIRNKAAHGKYGDYDAKHVEHLILGVRSFITRYPAQ